MRGMNSIAALLDQVSDDLDLVLRADAADALSNAEAMDLLRAAGALQRRVDALVVDTLAAAESRPQASGEDTFAGSFGCRNRNELVQRVLRVDAAGASRVVKAVRILHRDMDITSGAWLPSRWPRLREALMSGVIGIPGLLAATGPIDQAGRRIGEEDRWQADAHLAACARGSAADPDAFPADADADADVDPSGADAAGEAPPATPEDLRLLARVIVAYLDPDGAEPAAERALQDRYLTLGREKNGLIPVHGAFLPDAAAQLQRLLDAYTSPRTAEPPTPGVSFHPTDDADSDAGSDAERLLDDLGRIADDRTGGQKRHDALAAILAIAARSEDVPTIGGAAPTLVVSVTAEDYARGAGWAHADGIDVPVPVSVARHTACGGTVQRVLFDEHGRIISISSTDRTFNAHQRRAIALRDRECLIPGCHVRASWCEIHHVHDHARGGPTHTDNGVALCWWHHRSLDRSGWDIRMTGGVPQIRGPAWWDPSRTWRDPRPTPLRR